MPNYRRTFVPGGCCCPGLRCAPSGYARYRKTGRGWQTRINADLREGEEVEGGVRFLGRLAEGVTRRIEAVIWRKENGKLRFANPPYGSFGRRRE